ncbi:alpha/beta fold hydrolase [Bifidobacterium aquikefiricola]|uniref:Alpha/beta hydrolase n=1 Tax=Bifidobacterium aquikefiricola TaxID=3059038 RepID=A0AB39U5M4_9BIFI
MLTAHTIQDSRIRPVPAFGGLPVPPSVEILGVTTPAGELTVAHASPLVGENVKGSILAIPGFTGSKEDYYPILPLLARLGWDVWAYSQRGQADSFAPEGQQSYTREQDAADACAMAKIISSAVGVVRVHLLGHSFGGLVAQAAAIAHPERFESLTLMSSGPHGWPGRHELDRRILLDNPESDLWTLNNPSKATVPDAELDVLQRFLRTRSKRTSRDELLQTIDELAKIHDTSFAVKDTGLPVLIFHGENDNWAWPQEWQHRMARIIGARYEIVPDAAHGPQSENPGLTATLLDDFWSQTLLERTRQ